MEDRTILDWERSYPAEVVTAQDDEFDMGTDDFEEDQELDEEDGNDEEDSEDFDDYADAWDDEPKRGGGSTGNDGTD